MAESTRIRLDKWLVYARVVKSRTLAQELVACGHVRVNREKIRAADRQIGSGDVLTITCGGRIRILRLVAIAERRGPASEAQLLYEDISQQPNVRAVADSPDVPLSRRPEFGRR